MPLLRPILRGARLRCPACGEGRLFSGYDRVAPACPSCHAPFVTTPGEWTGALMFAQGGFSTVALGGWFVLFLLGHGMYDAGPLAWLIGWGIVAPLLLYRNFKGAWVGLLWGTGALDEASRHHPYG